jgi:hypothetical protein
MHFLAARTAYRAYLDNGRGFVFAQSLRRTNGAARDLLARRGYLLPAELHADAAALIAHYDVWTALWIDHRRRTMPAPNDPFVFENSFTYPREAEQRIEALYAELAGAD